MGTRNLRSNGPPTTMRSSAFLGLGTGSWYRRRALRGAGLKPGMSVLDVRDRHPGCSPCAAARLSVIPRGVTGVDPSPGMIEARQRASRRPAPERQCRNDSRRPDCAPPTSSASATPLLAHFSDLSAAFAEFHRVIQPGRLWCLEIYPAGRGPLAPGVRSRKSGLTGSCPGFAAWSPVATRPC